MPRHKFVLRHTKCTPHEKTRPPSLFTSARHVQFELKISACDFTQMRSQELNTSYNERLSKSSQFHYSHHTTRHLQTLADFNPLNPELNPICYLLALLAYHFLHVSRIMVKSLTLRLLMSYIYIYIYMERIFLMFLDHTQRRSTVGRTPLDE